MRARLEIREGYLFVEASGAFEAQHGREAIGQIIAACASHGLTRVLVDARQVEKSDAIGERFEVARELAERREVPLKIAILVAPAQLATKALEDSACNRGVPLRTTASPEEAYGFLGLAPPG